MKPIFILFPGFASSELWWQYKFTGSSKLQKLNFVNELKKIGDVYMFTFNFFNLDYYVTNLDIKDRKMWNKIYEKYSPHSSNIDFNLEDLNYDVICEAVYNDVRHKYGGDKPMLIPIGHSYGAELALLFSKMYKKECLFAISIDGTFHSLTIQRQIFEEVDKPNEKLVRTKFSNNKDLHKILDKIKDSFDKQKNVNDEIDMVTKMISYKSTQYKINNFNEKLSVMTIFFRAVHTANTKDPDNEFHMKWNNFAVEERKEIIKKNKKNMFKFRFMLNAPHAIWFDETYSNDMLDEIKVMLGYCS